MTQALVVATGPVTEATHKILANVARVVVASDNSEDTLLEFTPGARGFIMRGDSRLSKGVAAASQFQVIGRSGIGVDGVAIAATSRRRIPVVVTPYAGFDAIAEGVFGMLLVLVKRLSLLDAMVRSGAWADRDNAVVGDLNGTTLGIMGLGRIGRRVVHLASAFGMHLLATDPVLAADEIREAGAELVPLSELFGRSHHLTLYPPLQPDARGIVTGEFLQTAGPGAFLVNLARGGLIESADSLFAALDSGPLAGVGLDVFEPEPPDLSHSLYSDEWVLLSPHTLSLTTRSRHRIFDEMSRGTLAVLQGGRAESVGIPNIYESESEERVTQ